MLRQCVFSGLPARVERITFSNSLERIEILEVLFNRGGQFWVIDVHIMVYYNGKKRLFLIYVFLLFLLFIILVPTLLEEIFINYTSKTLLLFIPIIHF